jgi:hypothetical protein
MSTQRSDDFNPWVCQPETVQLDLEWRNRAFYILIKKRLNTGEDRAVRGAAIHGMRGFAKPGQDPKDVDPELLLNWKLAGYTRLETYIVEWSLATEAGVKLPIPSKDRGQLEALDSALTDVMENAITAFIEARDAAEEPLKKVGSSSIVHKLSA